MIIEIIGQSVNSVSNEGPKSLGFDALRLRIKLEIGFKLICNQSYNETNEVLLFMTV